MSPAPAQPEKPKENDQSAAGEFWNPDSDPIRLPRTASRAPQCRGTPPAAGWRGCFAARSGGWANSIRLPRQRLLRRRTNGAATDAGEWKDLVNGIDLAGWSVAKGSWEVASDAIVADGMGLVGGARMGHGRSSIPILKFECQLICADVTKDYCNLQMRNHSVTLGVILRGHDWTKIHVTLRGFKGEAPQSMDKPATLDGVEKSLPAGPHLQSTSIRTCG